MAKIELKLPPHCQVKKRNGYEDVYFMPHPKDRPDGWKPSIHLGRTDKHKFSDIETKASEVYEEYRTFRDKVFAGIEHTNSGSLSDIIRIYKSSVFWKDLSLRTQKDYELYITKIDELSKKSHHAHIKHLTPKHIVKFLDQYSDTPVAQKRAKAVMSVVFSMAVNEGFIDRNIVKEIRLARRKTQKRKVNIWTEDDIQTFIKAADESGWPSIGTAVLIANEIGQRQGDVLKLQKPRDYKDGNFIFFQNKTGKDLKIPATQRLKKRLETLQEGQFLLVCHENTRKQWHPHTFCHQFREIADSCGLKDHIFMHLRHTAVLNLEKARCTPGETATITGHSLKTVNEILEIYRVRDDAVAKSAILRLEKYRSHTKRHRRKSDKQ